MNKLENIKEKISEIKKKKLEKEKVLKLEELGYIGNIIEKGFERVSESQLALGMKVLGQH